MKNSTKPANYIPTISRGLTLREHFAGLALQGLLANETFKNPGSASVYAVTAADELLKELERTGKK